jgi:FMN phosphatase YigB (HAD superfamily)
MRNINKGITALLIDLDGTLWDEHSLKTRIKNTLSPEQRNAIPNMANRILNKNGFYTWTLVFVEFGIDYCSLIKRFAETVKPFHNVKNTLSFLSKKFSLYLTSDGGIDYTSLKLELLGLQYLFTGILTSDRFGKMKQQNSWWADALGVVGGSVEEVISIGDSLDDILPPSKIGLRTIFITEDGPRNDFSLPKGCEICQRFTQVPDLLKRLNFL